MNPSTQCTSDGRLHELAYRPVGDLISANALSAADVGMALQWLRNRSMLPKRPKSLNYLWTLHDPSLTNRRDQSQLSYCIAAWSSCPQLHSVAVP